MGKVCIQCLFIMFMPFCVSSLGVVGVNFVGKKIISKSSSHGAFAFLSATTKQPEKKH
jgi:hypothetical protein